MRMFLGGNIKSRGFFLSASFLFVCLFFWFVFFSFSLFWFAVRKPNGQSDRSTPLNRKLMIVAFEIKLSPGLKSQLD